MVCKEDVLTWFKELESYKRIDAMCSLLNMCLPFELRFVGTYVEELGKRDFQELRGAELRANNPTELAHDVAAAAQDPRAPRKMALYVSLLRSCNTACAATLYAVLVGLERAGLLAGLRAGNDPLEELLLLYSMALHHPAFTFDQRSHFGDILDRLKLEEARHRQPAPPLPPLPSAPSPSPTPAADDYYSPPPPPHPSHPSHHHPHPHPHRQPNESHRYPDGAPCGNCLLANPSMRMYMKTPQLQGPPVTSDQMNDIITPVIVTNAPSSNEPLMPVLPEGVLPPPTYPVPPYNMLDYNIPHGHWPEVVMPEMLPPEPSSPCDSRPVSPNVQVPPPPLPVVPRVTPRSAQETQLPPPLHDSHHHQQHQLVDPFNNLNLNDIKHMDEDRLHDLGISPNVVAQLRSLEKINGLQRPSQSSKPPSSYSASQIRHQQSSGSESGSSTGSHSPPDTPALSAPGSIGHGRQRQPSPPLYLFHHYPRPVFSAPFPSYRPNFTPFTANGEAPMYGPQYNPSYVPIPMFTQPKVSCFNCGTTGHTGSECKEPSIEEVTRAGGYQLDYSTAPPDINDK
ncbi:uncharacterized protein LOC143910173 isoform X2 [Arctopsyche grandis]|uniref:uncharacterized protein LOC143910173 isoform X2 n=1 Tax=Arctopsyche grandis TaxID=121162 RepID=UPI00406DA140